MFVAYRAFSLQYLRKRSIDVLHFVRCYICAIITFTVLLRIYFSKCVPFNFIFVSKTFQCLLEGAIVILKERNFRCPFSYVSLDV